MDVPQLAYLFTSRTTLTMLGCVQFWVIMNKATINIVYRFLCGCMFYFSWVSGIAESCGKFIFNFVRNCQAFFQSG